MIRLTLTQSQHKQLHDHLFKPDGCESVAVILCGMRAGKRTRLSAFSVHLVPDELCANRTPTSITWPTEFLLPLIELAQRRGLSLVKMHGHKDYAAFSEQDNASDRQLFPSLHGWFDHAHILASSIMMENGRVFGRSWSADEKATAFEAVTVVGDEISIWFDDDDHPEVPEFGRRIAQSFGSGTYSLLRKMKIGVVGCSGTGSPVVEMLARNCVGALVLIDPDYVEEKNLNRIINSSWEDGQRRRSKVDVLASAVERIGLNSTVIKISSDIFDRQVVYALADCDVIFGCVDSIDGRQLLNTLATYYTIPYFDLGVRIDADGYGNVDQVCGSVHYLQPGGSSLLSRHVYSTDQLRAAGLQRTNPQQYRDLLAEGYIKGVAEDRPAVIQLNMLIASIAINEFLARIHPYRIDPNADFATRRISLSHNIWEHEGDGQPCPLLSRKVGRGDLEPPLEWAELS